MMSGTEYWPQRAFAAVLSLWSSKELRAWRHSADKAEGHKKYRPTVTFNVLVTLAEYGIFSEPYVSDLPKVGVDAGEALRSIGNASSHLRDSSHQSGSRRLIFLSHFMSALRALSVHADGGRAHARIKAAADDAIELFVGTFAEFGSGAKLSTRLLESPYLSPFLLLYARAFIVESAAVRDIAGGARVAGLTPIDSALQKYFEREVDRLMAHRSITEDPGFDPASLCFALKGLTTYEREGFRESAFFSACVKAVIEGQNADGTWPDGICALVPDNADMLQQPSAKIALTLAQLVFEPRMLVRSTPGEMGVLNSAMPAFERTATYLATTYVARTAEGSASGWVSDRVRWPHTADTWITTLAARFFLSHGMARLATERAAVLDQIGARWPAGAEQTLRDRSRSWRAKVIEPDKEAKPCAIISEHVIAPILKQQEKGRLIVKPDRNGVSMIIFGPPGSGKTYFVDQLAACLGWPVVDLNPGHFIRDGAELIETRAREIFDLLGRLNHAVVFFDECDELFRDREGLPEATRNVLSFVTASMLPKLQQLHDQQRIVFILATNYLSRVDKAVRRPGRFDHVLLFDRPDTHGRRLTLRRAAKARGIGIDLTTAVMATQGLTTKEILDGLPRQKWEGTRSDYEEWCRSVAPAEIDASRYSDGVRARLRSRWASFAPTKPAARRVGAAPRAALGARRSGSSVSSRK
jgi:hypothetical protein